MGWILPPRARRFTPGKNHDPPSFWTDGENLSRTDVRSPKLSDRKRSIPEIASPQQGTVAARVLRPPVVTVAGIK